MLISTLAILYLNIKSKTKKEDENKEAEEIANLNAEIVKLKDSLNVSLVEDYEAMVKRLEATAAIDSMLIANKTTQIDLLKDTNKLLEQKVKLVRPKWYENKWLYFTYGVVLTATSVKLAGQIVD